MNTSNNPSRFNVVARALRGAGRKAAGAALAGCMVASLAACTSASAGAASSAASGFASTAAASTAVDSTGYDLSYSDHDLDASYDASTATSIELSGTTASVSGSGAVAQGSTVTITEAGVYAVSGSLSDGQIVVSAADSDKVQIVLNGASITSSSGPALYVESADKVFVTLAAGTQNALADSSSAVTDSEGDALDAALYSTADLTLQGTGSLSATGSCNDGIKSKDDLVITGGTYTVSAVGDALVGKDCVKVKDGSFALTAGKDGIASSNEDDADHGFVSIDGGSFSIDAADDGVQAAHYIRVADGSLNVKSGDDALHSDLDLEVTGGSVGIEAGDDGVHAEYGLSVSGGTVDVKSSLEGLEGQSISVSGGEVSIVSSDDGMNAATADATASPPERFGIVCRIAFRYGERGCLPDGGRVLDDRRDAGPVAAARDGRPAGRRHARRRRGRHGDRRELLNIYFGRKRDRLFARRRPGQQRNPVRDRGDGARQRAFLVRQFGRRLGDLGDHRRRYGHRRGKRGHGRGILVGNPGLRDVERERVGRPGDRPVRIGRIGGRPVHPGVRLPDHHGFRPRVRRGRQRERVGGVPDACAERIDVGDVLGGGGPHGRRHADARAHRGFPVRSERLTGGRRIGTGEPPPHVRAVFFLERCPPFTVWAPESKAALLPLR